MNIHLYHKYPTRLSTLSHERYVIHVRLNMVSCDTNVGQSLRKLDLTDTVLYNAPFLCMRQYMYIFIFVCCFLENVDSCSPLMFDE